ncbi:MAG: hypothetical protein CBC27_02805 [Opitutia bacterium TMED67]|nr:hypothetical protein [Verrucomicrobiales bacterium]MAZ11996.1 hypothetical protein [Verrucomicrobiales bacterium]OUU73865.1 MAG: hypothetical protein CBC27_02805 [Opitutae bacterium TMED67]RZO60816.1 MAG: DUF1552 domain-containing protein [Limisphaerales bacterium]|tara:strand:- start:2528 stop:3841 length:1314 start_codon:yes stop_codon:yes gene_type:complete
MNTIDRRQFIRNLGVSSTSLPFLLGLPSLGLAKTAPSRKRLVVMFSPNGTIPKNFWPESTGSNFELKKIMEPLAPFRNRMLVLNGLNNKVRGDGDSHMRGMSCLLTGIELFPGNIQGGSDTPAGWAKGISIDQEIKNFFQSQDATRTRFGSLEFGVGVSDRADPWTRMSYAGPNQPVAPTDDPYQMYKKLYGQIRDRDSLLNILDIVRDDLKRVSKKISTEDKLLLKEHADFVRQMEQEFTQTDNKALIGNPPKFEAGITNRNDNVPRLSRMQIDLMVNSFVNDFARVGTLQYTKSVGQARMNWLNINDGHHGLSHESDKNDDAVDKLTRINKWFAGELAYLTKRLAETPEPGANGSLLDNTTIVWTNELGKGNSHTLNNIPFVLIGNGMGFRMGRSLNLKGTAHNRLMISMAHAMGHNIKYFGNKKLSQGGPIDLS